MNQIASRAGRTVKRWWLALIAGILLCAGGIVVFCYPVESYATLSIMFGILMLITGITELVVATSRNLFLMRGYSVIGGIIDVLLGLFLCCNPGITLLVLPVVLGVYLLYHSFMIIGFGSDASALNIPGSGWATTIGVILLILSIFILVKPFTIGTKAVVILTGVAFLLAGIACCLTALKLKNIHKYLEEYLIDEQ